MTEEQDELVAPSPTLLDEDPNTGDQAGSPSAEDDVQDSSPETRESGRESLLEKLAAGSLGADEGLESDEEKTDAETPTEDEPPEEPANEDDQSSESEANESEGDEAEENSEDVEDEATEEPDETDVPASVQARFDDLAKQRREIEAERDEAKAKAQYVDDLNAQMVEKSIGAEDMDAWIKLGFDVQENSQQAPYTFLQLAVNMGLTHDQIVEALGIQTGPKGLDADLQKMVDEFKLTDEVAHELQAQRKPVASTTTLQAPRITAPTPDPTPNPAQQAAPMAEPGSLPTLTNPSGISEEAASKAVVDIDSEFATKYPQEWPKWKEELRSKLAEKQGLPFNLWASTTRELAELIVKSHKQAVIKPNRSQTRGGKSRAPAKKVDAHSKEDLIGRMTSGNILS